MLRFYNNLDDVGNTREEKKHLCTLPLNLYNDKVRFDWLFSCLFSLRDADLLSYRANSKIMKPYYHFQVFCVIVVMMFFLLFCMLASIVQWAYRFMNTNNREGLIIHILKKEDGMSRERFVMSINCRGEKGEKVVGFHNFNNLVRSWMFWMVKIYKDLPRLMRFTKMLNKIVKIIKIIKIAYWKESVRNH